MIHIFKKKYYFENGIYSILELFAMNENDKLHKYIII